MSTTRDARTTNLVPDMLKAPPYICVSYGLGLIIIIMWISWLFDNSEIYSCTYCSLPFCFFGIENYSFGYSFYFVKGKTKKGTYLYRVGLRKRKRGWGKREGDCGG